MSGRPDSWSNGLGRGMDRLLLMRWDLILLLALLALSWPLAVERGLIAQADYPDWAAVIRMLDREVFPQCHWFWAVPFPRVNAGEIIGQPYSLSMILPWLLLQVMPLEWALKLMVPAACLALGFGFYCFTAPKSSRFAAALGGYLCVLDNLWVINYGMWYNSVSLGLAFFFFIALERFVERRRTGAWIGAVLLLTLIMLAHPVGMVLALAGWLGFFFLQLIRRGRSEPTFVSMVLGIPVLALGMALPQVVATAVGSPWGAVEETSNQYHPFTMLPVLLGHAILLVSLYGLVGAVRTRKQVLWLILPPLLLAFVLYRNWLVLLPFEFPLKRGMISCAIRFRLVASSATLVLFALGLARVQAAWRFRRGVCGGLGRWVLGLAFLVTVLLGLHQTFRYQPRIFVGEKAPADHTDFRALCDWMDKNIDYETERVYVENAWDQPRDFAVYPASPVTGFLVRVLRARPNAFTHYTALISLRTKCQQVNGFAGHPTAFDQYYCCDGCRLFNTTLKDLTPGLVRERLWALNCRHIVAFSDAMREFLASLDFLRCSCQCGRYWVFTWPDMLPHDAWSEGPPPQPIPTTRVSAVRYQVDLTRVRAATVYLSVQYHLNWKAYLDGRPVPVIPWKGLVSVPLPAGGGGSLAVGYELHRALPLGGVAASTGALLLVALVRRLRGTSNVLSGPGRQGGAARAAHLCRAAIQRRKGLLDEQ
jgi:hypothetical protein